MRTAIATALLLLAACGDGLPEPASDGPRIDARLERSWPGDGPAREAAFSADGGYFASTSASGAVTIRRTSDWRETRRITHPGGATSADFSSDGSRLYTGGYDGVVRAWDAGSGRQVKTFGGAEGTVWSVDVRPDGRRLAAAGEDRLVRIWTLGSDSPPSRLAGHERNIWEVRFSPDGTHLASGSFDTKVRIWNAATGATERLLSLHSEAVVGLAYSPGGALLATAGDDSRICFWRTRDGALLRTIDNGNHAYKLAFSPDGRWLASAGRARGVVGTFWHQLSGLGAAAAPVHLWRVADGALIQTLPHPDDVMYVGFSPDGRWLSTAGEDGAVRIWRLKELGRR
jgi:WD40 repeat protein